MGKIQENATDYHLRRETDERNRATAAKHPRAVHSHLVMAERHRLFAIEEMRNAATESRISVRDRLG